MEDYGEEGGKPLLQAMQQRASFDVRVNRLHANRKGVMMLLKKSGIEAKETKLSPDNIRLPARPMIADWPIFRQGWIEPQDESSQLAALLVDARPGMAVMDWCAGAGGKSMALAAIMQNKGRIIAMDNDETRLAQAPARFKRAKISMIETRLLDSAGHKWVKRQAERIRQSDKQDKGFDRILLDVPCSGSGTWRRNPDQKWRLNSEKFTALGQIQADIMDKAAPLVKLGGRLIYVTCSLFARENQQQQQAFLQRHDDFRLIPVFEVWQDLGLPHPYPSDDKSILQLHPDHIPSDGFFIAIFERIQ